MAIPEIRKIFSGKILREDPKIGEGPKKESAPPSKPKTLFEEKGQWQRRELTGKMIKASSRIPGTGGARYSRRERIEMIKEIFPEKRFGTHISEMEAKKRLREMRREEYQAGISLDKQKLRRQRSFLERETGLGGKY